MPTLNLIETLSDKEKTVYDMLCENMSNEEIAERLNLSMRGVVWRLSNVYKKLGVSSESKSDLHLCRQRAISYGGTKIIEEITPKQRGEYTREDILGAAKRLRWYDVDRVNDIIEDLLQVLDDNTYNKITSGVSKAEYRGNRYVSQRDKELLKLV